MIVIHVSMRTILEYAGYEVKTAQFELDAMNFLSTEVFDLYLLSKLLPDVSSLELCTKFRIVDSFTPIVLLPSSAALIDESKAALVGAQGYVIKPYGLHKLEGVIAGILGKEPMKKPRPSGSVVLTA